MATNKQIYTYNIKSIKHGESRTLVPWTTFQHSFIFLYFFITFTFLV